MPVTQAQYARDRDCQRSSVARAIETGRLHGPALVADGKRILIDPVEADRQWPRPEPTADRLSQADRLAAARLLKEERQAQLMDLRARQRAGELVRVSQVERALVDAAAAARAALEQLPSKLAPQLAAESEQTAIRALLSAAITEVLTDLGDALQQLAITRTPESEP